MLTFHLGPLSRRARMFLQLVAGCLGLGLLIGPTFLALAGAPPIAAAASWTPLRLLAVKPFHNLDADTCTGDPRVYLGPTAVQGTIVDKSSLERRLAAAVFACGTGSVTISATVDAHGTITGVRSGGNTSLPMQRCLSTHVLEGEPVTTRGPGTLHAAFFMGR